MTEFLDLQVLRVGEWYNSAVMIDYLDLLVLRSLEHIDSMPLSYQLLHPCDVATGTFDVEYGDESKVVSYFPLGRRVSDSRLSHLIRLNASCFPFILRATGPLACLTLVVVFLRSTTPGS